MLVFDAEGGLTCWCISVFNPENPVEDSFEP